MDMIRGRCLNVWIQPHGSATTVDAYEDDTTLLVEDASDFTEEGGTLSLYNGVVMDYSSADMDADEITLASALAADVPEGKLVKVHPMQTRVFCTVEVLGFDDPLEALVPHYLRPILPEGSRDAAVEQEEVKVFFDGEQWVLFDVQGVPRVKMSVEVSDPRRVFRYTSEGVGGSESSYDGVKFQGYSGELNYARMQIVGGTLTGATFSVLLRGSVIGVLEVLPGEEYSADVDLGDEAFIENDIIRIEHTDPQDAVDIIVWVHATLLEGLEDA